MKAVIEILGPDLSLGMTENEFRNTIPDLQYVINECIRLTVTLESRLKEINTHLANLVMFSGILSSSVADYPQPPSAQYPSTSGPNHWDESLFYDVVYRRGWTEEVEPKRLNRRGWIGEVGLKRIEEVGLKRLD
jgi:hypothetical protein